MNIRSTGRNLVVLAAATALLAGCSKGSDSTATQPTTADSTAPAASAAPTSAAPAQNGVAALEPKEIISRAKAALKAAKSFRLNGTTNDGGQHTTLDLEISGSDVAGSMGLGNTKVQLLRVGGKQYMKGDAAFWKTNGGKNGDAVAQLIGNRWVVIPASNKDFASLFTVADVNSLLEPDGPVKKGAVKDIDGTPAIGLVQSGSDGGTLYVATTGKPYPLRLQAPKASDGAMSFSKFGETFADIKKPAASDTVDFSKLGS